MRKYVLLITGIVMGTVTALCAVVLSIALMDQSILHMIHGEWIIPVLIIIITVLLTGLHYCNDAYDFENGFAGIHQGLDRWIKHTVFASGIAVYITAAVLVIHHVGNITLLSLTQQIILFVSAFAAMTAIYFYLHQYMTLTNRKIRIQSLIRKHVRYKKRRYSLVAREVNEIDQKDTMLIKGMIHGTIRIRDHVHIFFPGQEERKSDVTGLKVDGKKVRKATDTEVSVYLYVPDDDPLIEKYSVITDIEQVSEKTKVNDIENPLLAGYILDYQYFILDHVFQSLLIWTICHSQYLVPGRVLDPASHDGDMMDPLQATTRVGFPSVMTSYKPGKPIVAAFSDWYALAKWPLMVNDPMGVTVVRDFPEMMDLMHKGYEGIVIDPFGPKPFFLSKEFAESITNTEGYQEDILHHKNEDDTL